MGARLTRALAFCLLVAPDVARAAADYRKNELWVGGGVAISPENSIFNAPNDVASGAEGAVSSGYLRHLSAHHALGLHFYGTTQTTATFPYQGASGSQPAQFELNTYDLGLRYRYTFTRRSVIPYLFVGASGVSVLASSNAPMEFEARGVSACAGPGIGMRLGSNFMLSAEGIASFGAAKWTEPPAANSTDTKFDPSHYGGVINLSVVWGVDRPAPPTPRAPAVADSGLAASRLPSVGNIVLAEALILLASAPARAGDEGAALAGVTAASALLGAVAGNSPHPKSRSAKIMFYGLLSLAALELTAGKSGASEEVLFGMSFVGWNGLCFWAWKTEQAEKARP